MKPPPTTVPLHACEAELLHLSGQIQSFGALLRIDTDSGLITHASANLPDLIGVSVSSVLGQVAASLPWLSADLLAKVPEPLGKSILVPVVIETGEQDCNRVEMHLIRSHQSIVIEIERVGSTAEPIAVLQHQKPLFFPPHDSSELADYHNTLLESFRSIIGFERVMIYRFQEDWSGVVVAESSAAGMGSYLDLHFPASDIPAIARNLYMINPSRMIADAQAAAVAIIGIHPEPPDLTWSDLRSVSPVHLQYLSNMGVGASFSVPIRVADKLWGLVACHHSVPRQLSPDQRKACVSLTHAYALGLTSHFASLRLRMLDSLERRVDGILETLARFDDPLDGIEPNAPDLMEAMSAQGFAMAVGDNVVIAGDGPGLEGLSIIDDWFLNACSENLASTDHLAGLFPDHCQELASISGLVAIKVRGPQSGWVRFYWFRPAEEQEVAWAGNPNKPMIENAGATQLSPRRSFERWVEIKTGHSRSWSNEDKLVASRFRTHLLRWL